MFSVKNKSNVRQVTPFAEFGPYEAKTFYPVSQIYANALDFFSKKLQFDVVIGNIKPITKIEVQKPALIPEVEAPVVTTTDEVQTPAPIPEVEATEEKPKLEEVPVAITEPAEAPVVETKPKSRRTL